MTGYLKHPRIYFYIVAPVFESVYKTENFLSCLFSDLWTIFTDIVSNIFFRFVCRPWMLLPSFLTPWFLRQIIWRIKNTDFSVWNASISLKMKPFGKLTSHRLCQQLKCPQTSAGLVQSVDRLHCGRSLVWAPGPDLYPGSLKNNWERKVQDVKIGSLISTLALNTLTLNVRFLKVISRLFPACDQALRAGMGPTFFLAR